MIEFQGGLRFECHVFMNDPCSLDIHRIAQMSLSDIKIYIFWPFGDHWYHMIREYFYAEVCFLGP